MIGSLCSGYGGLDQAAEQITGGTTAWHCEYADEPATLLAARYPGVPNHRDLKTLEWADDSVDIVTAGWPCQPFSGAGKRLGTEDPRHLFPWISLGLQRMRPELFLGENVRGHLSLGFDVVLAELDRIGYDVRWTLLRASDVGAPHGRARLWIAARAREHGGWATPAGQPVARLDGAVLVEADDGLFGAHPLPVNSTGSVPLWAAGTLVRGEVWSHDHVVIGQQRTLLPTPGADNSRGLPSSGTDYGSLANSVCALLPTPVASDSHTPPTVACSMRRRGERGNSLPLSEVVNLLATPCWYCGELRQTAGCDNCEAGPESLLPTPRATDGTKGGPNQRGSSGDLMLPSAVQLLPTPVAADGGGVRASSAGWGLRDETRLIAASPSPWGPYAAAVARWEALVRPTPPPTEQGRNGPRLSPAFVEWMQGLPAGWVTGPDLGLSRNAQLTILGNGVVPMQAEAAFGLLLADWLAAHQAAA